LELIGNLRFEDCPKARSAPTETPSEEFFPAIPLAILKQEYGKRLQKVQGNIQKRGNDKYHEYERKDL
jgi:hypothetical protein